MQCNLTKFSTLIVIEYCYRCYLFNLSGEISIFEDESARRMGRMKQLTILPVTSPNVHQLKKIHQQKRVINV